MNNFLLLIKSIIRIILIAIVSIADSILMLINLFVRPDKYNFYKHYQNWSNRILRICNIKIDIVGLENIKSDKTYIYISNHSSLFDIPILFSSITDEIRIIYKKELEKIPIFGYGLKKSKFISIIRDDPKKALGSLNEAIRAIKENISVIVFPEGTRSKDGNLGEFKRGALILAFQSGKPIIPITIVGSFDIMPPDKKTINSGNVKLIIHPEINLPADAGRKQENEFIQLLRDTISSGLTKN